MADGPRYIPAGSEQTLRSPGTFNDIRYYFFLLDADGEVLQRLCDRYLNLDPTGAVRYVPLGAQVLLAFSEVGELVSGDPSAGTVAYRDIAFWVPVLSGTRLGLFPAYIFVDNPHTLVTAREVFGLPKQLGRFGMPAAPEHAGTATFSTDVLGYDAPGTPIDWRRLFEVVPHAGLLADLGRTALRGADALTAFAAHEAVALVGGRLPAGIGLPGLLRTARAVGLKQFRDAADPDRACYQAVVEAPLTLTRFREFHVLGGYDFVLHALASHPVARDLGLAAGRQRVAAAFFLRADMRMEAGVEAWRAPARRKVAVLGGGIASLAAVFALTEQKGWGDRYEVTVYQQGWRLGGKGASGRNDTAGERIEEHGLHVWFGFYENAFKLIRRCYAELGAPPGSVVARWDRAFLPQDLIVVNEHFQRDGRDEWVRWPVAVPRNADTPGDGHRPRLFTACLRFVLATLRDQLAGLRAPDPRMAVDPARDVAVAPGAWARLFESAALHHLAPAEHAARHGLDLALQTLDRAADRGLALLPLELTLGAAAGFLGVFNQWFWHQYAAAIAEPGTAARKLAMVLDTVAAIVTGVHHDRLWERDLAAIDDQDFRAWLATHGAREVTVRTSPSVRFIYNAAFAFEGGVPERAAFAAGAALRGVIRLIGTYRGAIVYRMAAGMGDVIFAPLYEVLRRRGVRFRFFHRVEELEPGGGGVETIRLTRQAELAGADYAPLRDVHGLPCWPHRPRFEQLRGGDDLRAREIDLEDPDAHAPGESTVVLRRGEDFDAVVLGIPVAVLPRIAPKLIAADPRWAAMVKGVGTVATQAFQVWLDRDLATLGWKLEGGGVAHLERPVLGTYVEPLDTYCDMTHLLDREAWAPGTVRSIAYFCGVIDDVPGETAADARARARANAETYLRRDSPYLWPALHPQGAIDWSALVAPAESAGIERLGEQYVVANVYPSERYTLSLPGTTRYRLRAGDSGLANLVLAGDWVDNGLNSGCVEAAVMSGLQAARALSGVGDEVIGETDAWLWA